MQDGLVGLPRGVRGRGAALNPGNRHDGSDPKRGVLRRLHIIGGGARNALLNQFAADATGRAVVAGPVEATAAGNVLLQLMADGRIANLEEGRTLIRRSFAMKTYTPRDTARWDEAAARFAQRRAKRAVAP